MLRLASFSFL
ncbi:uncharacterized protein FFMR_15422 [Fusarium fujikuroi]|nr:uncharacterized protein FFMR_15422 [Fusarium fujikuroi]